MKKKNFHCFSELSVKTLLVSLAVLVFSVVMIFLIINLAKQRTAIRQKAVGERISLKKGVGGGATLEALSQLNASWFYNWGYTPGYKNEDNWDAEVWEKFVPLFTIKSWQSVAKNMTKICNKPEPDYCHGGYYLIGNEPMVKGQDYMNGYSEDRMASFSAEKIGLIAQAIQNKDPKAKLIILGLSSPAKTNFVAKFIQEWKTRWSGTEIANLADVIKGWHFHSYTFSGHYSVCPTDDSLPRNFKEFVDGKMRTVFGKTVPQQEIWITEMGSLGKLPNPNNKTEREKFLNRMGCLVNVYEASPIVNRYAWFYYGCDSEINSYCPEDKRKEWKNLSLFYKQNNRFSITDLGQKYANLPLTSSIWSCKGICYGSKDTCKKQACGGYPCTKINEAGVVQARKEGITNCWSGAYRCCTGPKPKSIATPTPKPQPTKKPSGLICTAGCYSSESNCSTNCLKTKGYNRHCTRLTADDKMCWSGAYRCCKGSR